MADDRSRPIPSGWERTPVENVDKSAVPGMTVYVRVDVAEQINRNRLAAGRPPVVATAVVDDIVGVEYPDGRHSSYGGIRLYDTPDDADHFDEKGHEGIYEEWLRYQDVILILETVPNAPGVLRRWENYDFVAEGQRIQAALAAQAQPQPPQ